MQRRFWVFTIALELFFFRGKGDRLVKIRLKVYLRGEITELRGVFRMITVGVLMKCEGIAIPRGKSELRF